MSQDQAAGLRQWADAQREKQAQGAGADESLESMAFMPASDGTLEPDFQPSTQEVPRVVIPHQPLKPLFVISLAGQGVPTRSRVKSRLGQWSALAREWAGSPDGWDIHVISPEAPELARLTAQHARWALWVNSDADAFAQMYRALRIARENGGPRRLLALHEPHLTRQGLLNNLRDAAARYLATDLLLLAR